MKSQRNQQPNDDLLFTGSVTDLTHEPALSQEDLEKKLFTDAKVQTKIDEFEAKVLGIKKADKPVDSTFETIVLTPSKAKDREMLSELMNNSKKYNLLKWSENWTRLGDFKVFLVYQKLKEKAPKKPEEDGLHAQPINLNQ